jgi:acyl carrier protein
VVHTWTNPALTRKSSPALPNAQVQVKLHDEGVSVAHSSVGRPSGGGQSYDSALGEGTPVSQREQTSPHSAIEVDRAAERIEAWLLGWLVERLALDAADVGRDRPFAEFGVDSLTAVELSHELEVQFKVPLPPIVAWNYPTPAALARYLAEQSLGVDEPSQATVDETPSKNGAAAPSDDSQLAALLADVENLSDDEAARLLAEEQRPR